MHHPVQPWGASRLAVVAFSLLMAPRTRRMALFGQDGEVAPSQARKESRHRRLPPIASGAVHSFRLCLRPVEAPYEVS